eukprot:scaffold69906_cov63-Phaeocystis_antarctica.AAC.3
MLGDDAQRMTAAESSVELAQGEAAHLALGRLLRAIHPNSRGRGRALRVPTKQALAPADLFPKMGVMGMKSPKHPVSGGA